MKFKKLELGDIFNCKSYRGTKIGDSEAIVIMSGIHQNGDLMIVDEDTEVIPVNTLKEAMLLEKALRKLRDLGHIYFDSNANTWKLTSGEVL